MSEALLDAIKESVSTNQVSDQVVCLLRALVVGEMGSSSLMAELDLSHRPTFRKNYLDPAWAEEA